MALQTMEHGYPDPAADPDRPLIEGLRAGAIVLMVASFERFMRACIAEQLERLQGDPPPVSFNALPSALRVASVFEGLQFALKEGAPAKKELRLGAVVHSANRISRGLLAIQALSDTKSNPNADRVAEVLRGIAIADPFAVLQPAFLTKWGAPEVATFCRDKLDEIVNRRHVTAHTGAAANLTRQYLVDASRFLDLLAETIEETVQAHVDAILSAQP
jgi:hypothetical protein